MTLRQRAAGVLALLGLAGILIGLPTLLIALGADTLPRTVPTWDQVRSALLAPDDGTLALTVLYCLGWVVWALLSVTILLEVVAQVSRVRVPPLPGLRLPQSSIHGVVATALALFMVVPGFTPHHAASGTTGPAAQPTTATAAWDASTANPVASPRSTTGGADHQTRAASQGRSEDGTAGITHLTQRGDTLWSLAEQYLGDGHRYPEIAAANPGLIDDPDVLDVGWRLDVSNQAGSSASPTPRAYTVRKGDTLSQIAQSELGDAARYGEIAEASAGITQPGGRHLHDPDLILPGWELSIPARSRTPAGDRPAADTSTADGAKTQKLHGVSEQAAGVAAQAAKAAAEEATGTAVKTFDEAADGAQNANPLPAADIETGQVQDAGDPPWVVTGLVGAGVVLAGALAALLARNRRAQFRARRPGRAIAAIDPVLAPLEKTLHLQQPRAQARVDAIDWVLRELAASCTTNRTPIPVVAAAQLSGERFTVHLSEAAELPDPWVVSGDPSHWVLDLPVGGQTGQPTTDRPAPYPLLVTIGEGDDGAVWLLNLEVFGTLAITGDQTYAEDFARYLAAEVACNPWASDVALHCVNVAPETARMNPVRVHVHDDVDSAAGQVLAETIAQTDTAAHCSTRAVQGRANQDGDELWPARVVLVGNSDSAALSHLLNVVDQHPQQSGTAVVVIHTATDQTPGSQEYADTALVIGLTSTGRVHLPSVGLDLVAAGLTGDEAAGIAALLEQSAVDTGGTVPHDPDATAGTWRAYTDHAGALREQYTVPRNEHTHDVDLEGADTQDHDAAVSLLPRDDTEYVHTGATTVEDLAELAPGVTTEVAEQVAAADPTLDADVAAWFADDCPLPRLTLLGPVKARTRGRAVAVAKSKDYYIELLAYLSTRPNGATMEEVTSVFNNSPGTVRKHISHLRDWLGTNPRTGQHHLPDARKAPAAAHRGVGVYQVQDLLVDADLFRRLRARAQTRGPAGVDDLSTALRLVTGEPLDPDSLRPTGWSWVFEGDRLDQHLVVAIVDVAHLVATSSITNGDLARARAAAKTAIFAAPAEETPRLDLAAVATAEGNSDEARHILTHDVAERSEDDSAPADLPARTRAILGSRPWPTSHAS